MSCEIQPARHNHQPTYQQCTKVASKVSMCQWKHILGRFLFLSYGRFRKKPGRRPKKSSPTPPWGHCQPVTAVALSTRGLDNWGICQYTYINKSHSCLKKSFWCDDNMQGCFERLQSQMSDIDYSIMPQTQSMQSLCQTHHLFFGDDNADFSLWGTATNAQLEKKHADAADASVVCAIFSLFMIWCLSVFYCM